MTMHAPDFWQERGALARALAPLGMLYGASVAWKARFAAPYRPQARVLCVGNLTAGGSGKTPVALALGAMLAARGHKVFFLSRGYGGKDRGPLLVAPHHKAALVGDEPLLLARVAPTIVSRDRAVGAALAETQGAHIIVMDDGHQNFSVAKDLSIVVVDGKTGFGNGLMIPAGPLREPVAQGLARADAVVAMNSGQPDLAGYSGPLFGARLVPVDDALRGRRLFAFAGIGRPEKFIASLGEAGVIIAGQQFFPDHHPFTTDDMASLKALAAKAGAPLVTTEKDFARLSAEAREAIAVLKVEARFDDDIAPLLDRLARAV